MGIELPAALEEARAFIGCEFPTTNESALRGRADEWRQLAELTSQVIARVEGGVDGVAGANVGPARDAFVAFMSGGGGNLGSLRDFRVGCERAAMGHEAAAMAIMALKSLMIAQLGQVAVAIHAAKPFGAPAIPFLRGVQLGARVAVEQATRATTELLMAG
ncbi:MAG: hypothetical protein GX596_15015 [Propionibacterium sp.]|nr:hypothetical protein [Propionibacterium sp.]